MGNQSLARSGRETNPEHHGCPACYEGVVYVGYIVQDDHGEELETYLALPCQRLRASALSSRSTGRPRGSQIEAPDRVLH